MTQKAKYSAPEKGGCGVPENSLFKPWTRFLFVFKCLQYLPNSMISPPLFFFLYIPSTPQTLNPGHFQPWLISTHFPYFSLPPAGRSMVIWAVQDQPERAQNSSGVWFEGWAQNIPNLSCSLLYSSLKWSKGSPQPPWWRYNPSLEQEWLNWKGFWLNELGERQSPSWHPRLKGVGRLGAVYAVGHVRRLRRPGSRYTSLQSQCRPR